MPRAGFDRATVIAAASELADEVGFAGLTMGLPAERVGVRTPSLYKHVDSLDALHRGVGLQAVRDISAVLTRAAVGRSGPDAVRAIAETYRKWALDHPGRYAASVRAPRPADEEYQAVAHESVQILFDVVAGFGLTDERAIDAVRALRTVIHGFVGLESDDAFQMERDPADSYRFVVDTLVNGMRAEAAIDGPGTAPLHAGEGS
ncbi:TetR/AcrR family transcriptional regulator [Streptomyces sp. NBC_01544]|uniref:TetR/AcrR family transcriptional regulator n=1 Tax=unclassified Streptomyces TaxID=2593676 RepID=UPI002ED0DF98|nr:TetR/AcrR family transcriptional regulator [Streptomyces sp. NBC_01617]WTI84939.1 TetR/AcrR family transcriptional regulator [Streptomyces sp. NBC_00724]